MKNDLALIGLGVMGSNLTLNIADHGYKIAVYNYTQDLVDKFKNENSHPNAEPFYDLDKMMASLKAPRIIIIMVTAGKAVDSVIEALKPYLAQGDIVLDLGNSNFNDTNRRFRELQNLGVVFSGVGVSGGSEGARHGPAIMVGGTKEAYDKFGTILEDISAHAYDGKPCCAFMGNGAAGHYVKMVHNGIEYADMQLIAESYLVLKTLGGFSNEELAQIFESYAKGPLESYLIKITAKVLKEKDPKGQGNLIDYIVDKAGQKGTGKWTCQAGFEVGVDLSMIDAACNARFISGSLKERTLRSKECKAQSVESLSSKEALIKKVENYLYVGKIAAYAQGFDLYAKASKLYDFDLNLGKIAEIFRAGCIIQAKFLNDITKAYERNPTLSNLIDDPFFKEKLELCLDDAREISILAMKNALPTPVMYEALAYIDGMRCSCVGANLIQGLRDYFGAHTFERIDEEGFRHHNWSN